MNDRTKKTADVSEDGTTTALSATHSFPERGRLPGGAEYLLEAGEDGFVVASAPGLPGTFSQGKTREEALRNLEEAVGLVDPRGGPEDAFPPAASDLLSELVPGLVRAVLASPGDLKWSAQGFGMLRTYLAPDVRLHVWDPALRVPGVSDVHTHPWCFLSFVASGTVIDHRFRELPASAPDFSPAAVFSSATIKCGAGAFVSDLRAARLSPERPLRMTAGSSYFLRADQIHRSEPSPGAVTVVRRRVPRGASPDHARVFWRGSSWVSAEPRPASREEVERACALALSRWDGRR